jgi:hypothetical protein
LTVILGGKRMPGTEDGPGPVWQARGIGAALRRGRPARGSGAARPGGGGAPAGLPPEGSRHGRRLGVGQQPRQLPALVLAVVPVSVTLPRSMSSRPLPASGPPARRLACRRRALEVVKEVVACIGVGVRARYLAGHMADDDFAARFLTSAEPGAARSRVVPAEAAPRCAARRWPLTTRDRLWLSAGAGRWPCRGSEIRHNETTGTFAAFPATAADIASTDKE